MRMMPLKYLSLSLCICLPLFVGCDDESSPRWMLQQPDKGDDGAAGGGNSGQGGESGTPHKAGALGSKTQGVQPVLVVLPDQAVWVVKRAMPVKREILVWTERRHRQASSAVSSSNQSN